MIQRCVPFFMNPRSAGSFEKASGRVLFLPNTITSAVQVWFYILDAPKEMQEISEKISDKMLANR